MITGTYNLVVDPQWRNVQQQEVFLQCDTTEAPVTINLFPIADLNGFWNVKIIISDANNNAATNNITINSNVSDAIDEFGNNQIVLNTNGESAILQAVSEKSWLATESRVSSYQVYTALLTQTGGDNQLSLVNEPLTIGVTYTIVNNGFDNYDFTNVGASNNLDGTQFVATGTTPIAWGSADLNYNTGAPIVTVLENTIGDIWLTYSGSGVYSINSNALFTIDKTWGFSASVYAATTDIIEPVFIDFSGVVGSELPTSLLIRTQGGDFDGDDLLNKTPIEIRVYN